MCSREAEELCNVAAKPPPSHRIHFLAFRLPLHFHLRCPLWWLLLRRPPLTRKHLFGESLLLEGTWMAPKVQPPRFYLLYPGGCPAFLLRPLKLLVDLSSYPIGLDLHNMLIRYTVLKLQARVIKSIYVYLYMIRETIK